MNVNIILLNIDFIGTVYGFSKAPVVQRPRMRPSHGRDPSSNLGRGISLQITLKVNSHNLYYETLIKEMEEKKTNEMEMAKKTSQKRKA